MLREEGGLLRWREVSPDVFYTDGSPVQVTEADLSWLQDKARSSALGRARLCAHATPEAGLHEMLICLSRSTYIRPHRHFKPESALILRGACDLVLFDEQGGIADVLPLGDPAGGGAFFVRLAQPVYHTYLLKSDFLVFLETTPGPFDRRLTEYAPWTPHEQEPSDHYLQELCRRVAIWRNSRP